MGLFGNLLKGVLIGVSAYFTGGLSLAAGAAAGGLSFLSSQEQDASARQNKRLQNRTLALQVDAQAKQKQRKVEGALVARDRSRRRLQGGLSSTIFGGNSVGGSSTLG